MTFPLRLPAAPLTLRAARPADAPVLGRILWRARRQSDWTPRAFVRGDCAAFCLRMISLGWVTVAEVRGRPAGFLARDGAEICALYVARLARKRGIGTALLQAAQAAQAERPRLWLHCRADNSSARNFYAAHGFTQMDRVGETLTLTWTQEGTP